MGKNTQFFNILLIVLLVIFSCFVPEKALALSTSSGQLQYNQTQNEVKSGCQKLLEASQLTSEIPRNPDPNILLICGNEIGVDHFAWETFVALNWPADDRGEPLKTTFGQRFNAPRVWESYKTPNQIFTDRETQPALQSLRLRFNEAAGLLANTIEFDRQDNGQDDLNILLASRKPLIDQNGNYTLNEIRINPIEAQQIVRNEWNSLDSLHQQGFNNDDNRFALVCSDLVKIESNNLDKSVDGYQNKFPCLKNRGVGAIEIKASWMIVNPDNIDTIKSDYYTTERTFFVDKKTSVDGTPKNVSLTVALVGFHILHKTSGAPGGWIWSTFEHIGNAPDAGNQQSEEHEYNFYNPNCHGEYCVENVAHAQTPYCWGNNFPYAVTRELAKECGVDQEDKIKQQPKSQITRLIPITPNAQYLSSRIWQPRLKDSVWQNYQLIGAQWVDPPTLPYNENGVKRVIRPKPDLVNVTLEPYVQNSDYEVDGIRIGRSCLACHTFAHLPDSAHVHSDFSFLFQELKKSSH